MATPSTSKLVDRIIPGGLDEFLILARGNGDSYSAIASRLFHEHDVAVTPPTVRKWCRDRNIPDPASSEKAEA